MLSWNDEMDNMLSALHRQIKSSLKSIKMALNRDGFSFNAEFKEYFLQSSYCRIKETYDQYEVISMFENQAHIDAYENTSDECGVLVSPIFGGSSDDDGLVENRPELKLSGTSSEIQCESYCEPYQFNHMNQIDENGCDDDDLLNVNLIDRGKNMDCDETDDTLKVDDDIPLIVKRKMDSINQRTSRKIMTAKLVAFDVDSRLTPKTVAKKNLLPSSSNELQPKKRFKCELCQYISNYSGNIKKHVRTHTGEKPYRCDICCKGFSQLGAMKIHKVTHTNEIPFHCRGCFTGFLQKAEKEAHEKMCKNRRYECHLCKKYVSNSKALLKRHMQKHIGEKPFRCEICMKRFSEKSGLNTHLKTIHTMNYVNQ